jgi:hypothetical protein
LKLTSLPALLVCVATAAVAQAQSFSYPDFSNTTSVSISSYTAAPPAPRVTPPGVVGTAIRITSSTPISQRGSVWYSSPVAVSGGFDTTFTYTISSQTSGGADGLAFVVQNDPRATAAIGRHASGIGYGAFTGALAGDAIANALVVEIDTFQTAGAPATDPNAFHIGVMTGGSGDCLQNHATHGIGAYSSATIGANGTHTVRVQYVPGTLYVYFDNLVTPVATIAYSFATGGIVTATSTPVGGLSLIGGTSANVGFVASTGGSCENHDLASWSFASTVTPPNNYCTAGTTTNGCNATMSGTGVPSASAGSGFTIAVANVEGAQTGILFYGMTPLASAWGAGSSFLCVKSPLERMGVQSAGGTNGLCDGALSIDWNAYIAANFGAVGTPFVGGETVYAQGWFRDPPAPKTTSLSDALQWTVSP